jgi:octaheme c-type cytochrome (tetrathionate reductase family)
MNHFKHAWVVVVGLLVSGMIAVVAWSAQPGATPAAPSRGPGQRQHLDHSAFFDEPFASGQDVTRACLKCHEEAAREVLVTPHFQWVGKPEDVRGDGRPVRIGKRNLFNNFCLGIAGNQVTCTGCHAGYGWKDEGFDFGDPANVDCLVCHDRSGAYTKGAYGLPTRESDLLASARSVGFPRRENCNGCHSFGGGGMGVKHGDLDASLDNPDARDDVHMGGQGMLCIDCHGGHGHDIRGKAFSVSTNHEDGIGCTDCHAPAPHRDLRLNQHTRAVSCEACHIPFYANSFPTKTSWDWSKAGDATRPDDPHHYLKIKGEFEYGEHLVPQYAWFDLSVERYLVGDRIADEGPTWLNRPRGARGSPGAKIRPFKVHRGVQPYDTVNRTLVQPVTSGEHGYWHDFDWNEAIRRGSALVGLQFSGQYGFTETLMHWPLAHMVQPAEAALRCQDCHGTSGRLNWRALGYGQDPMLAGAGADRAGGGR